LCNVDDGTVTGQAMKVQIKTIDRVNSIEDLFLILTKFYALLLWIHYYREHDLSVVATRFALNSLIERLLV